MHGLYRKQSMSANLLQGRENHVIQIHTHKFLQTVPQMFEQKQRYWGYLDQQLPRTCSSSTIVIEQYLYGTIKTEVTMH